MSMAIPALIKPTLPPSSEAVVMSAEARLRLAVGKSSLRDTDMAGYARAMANPPARAAIHITGPETEYDTATSVAPMGMVTTATWRRPVESASRPPMTRAIDDGNTVKMVKAAAMVAL